MDAPRLYLITPLISDAAAFAPILSSAVAACDIVCLLLRIKARDAGETKKTIKTLAPLAQKEGVACLIEGDPQLALRAEADGVHVEGNPEGLAAALGVLHRGGRADGIIGAGGLITRDEAMLAGEAGVDYLMFGGPACAEPDDRIVESVAWWAEIFNVPCIGYARNLSVVSDLVRAGADFIALSEAVFADPRGADAALRDAAARLEQAREPAH